MGDVMKIFRCAVIMAVLWAPLRLAGQEPMAWNLTRVLRELSSRTGDIFALHRLRIGRDDLPRESNDFDPAVINSYTDAAKLIPAYFRGYRVERSKGSPRLFFVVDVRIPSQGEDVMRAQLPALKFEGNETQWVVKIGGVVEGIGFRDWGSTPDVDRIVRGQAAKLSLAFTPMEVREALSACLDEDKTRGVAWISETTIKDGKKTTAIAYTRDAVFIEAEGLVR